MLGVQSTRSAAHRVVHPVTASASISPPPKAKKLNGLPANQKTQNLRSRTRQPKPDLDSEPELATPWPNPPEDEKKIEDEEDEDAGKVEMLTSEAVNDSEPTSSTTLTNAADQFNNLGDSMKPVDNDTSGDDAQDDTFNFVDFGDDANDSNDKEPSPAEKQESSSKLSTPLSELSPLPAQNSGDPGEDTDSAKRTNGSAQEVGGSTSPESSKADANTDSVRTRPLLLRFF